MLKFLVMGSVGFTVLICSLVVITFLYICISDVLKYKGDCNECKDG